MLDFTHITLIAEDIALAIMCIIVILQNRMIYRLSRAFERNAEFCIRVLSDKDGVVIIPEEERKDKPRRAEGLSKRQSDAMDNRN